MSEADNMWDAEQHKAEPEEARKIPIKTAQPFCDDCGDLESLRDQVRKLEAELQAKPEQQAATHTEGVVDSELVERLQEAYQNAFEHYGAHYNNLVVEVDMSDLHEAITALQQSKPEEWKCFQCGEVFTDKDKAAEHFGHYQHQQPACTIDVAEYRRMEELHRQYLNEETEKDRAMYSMRAEHATALRRAEEEGYNKGITENIKCLSVALRNEAANIVKDDGGYTKAERETIYKAEGLEVAADIIESQQSKPVVAEPMDDVKLKHGQFQKVYPDKPVVPDIEKAIRAKMKDGSVVDMDELCGLETAADIARDMLKDAYIADGEPVWCVVGSDGEYIEGTMKNQGEAEAHADICEENYTTGQPYKAIRYISIKE